MNRPQIYPTADEIQRFWSKVYKTPGGCWHWIGSFNGRRYGQISLRGKTFTTHRLSWVIRHGFIPAGMVICHKCDIKSCVNPDHLFLGTQTDNMKDLSSKHYLFQTTPRRKAFAQLPDKPKPVIPDFSPKLTSPYARPHGSPITKTGSATLVRN